MSDAFDNWLANTSKNGKAAPSTKTIEGLKGYVPSSNMDAIQKWAEVMDDMEGHKARRAKELEEIRARERNSGADEGGESSTGLTTGTSTRGSQVDPLSAEDYKNNYMTNMFNFFK